MGSRYRIDFNRWLVFDQQPLAGQIGRILNHDDFVGVYQAVDLLPEIAVSQVPEAKQALAALALKIPDNPDLQLILAFTAPPTPGTPKSQLAAFNAFLAISHLASLEAASRGRPRTVSYLNELTVDPGVFEECPEALRAVWHKARDHPANLSGSCPGTHQH